MIRPYRSLRALFGAPIARSGHPSPTRSFTTSAAANIKQLPPRPKPPPESEIEESFLKGSGPGGQKINKTNSAVQLRHIPTGIVVKSQATRSRSQNRTIARGLLAARLDELARGDESRTAIVGDVKQKRAASRAKKSRRKYRKLAEGKQGLEQEEGEIEGEKGVGGKRKGKDKGVVELVGEEGGEEGGGLREEGGWEEEEEAENEDGEEQQEDNGEVPEREEQIPQTQLGKKQDATGSQDNTKKKD